ncbi:VanW family protein [Heliobacterium mobile]|nr:VanW family protein [Heliobacterium mobile]
MSLSRKRVFLFMGALIAAGIGFSAYHTFGDGTLLKGLHLGKSSPKQEESPLAPPQPENSSPSDASSLPEEGTRQHPYGRPVKGPLKWEEDPRFQELCTKHRATIRMGAFQTTLPDPLPGEEYNVALAADMLAGTVIEPNQIFSMNKTIGPYTTQRGFQEGPTYIGAKVVKTVGGGVCKVATTLYNTTVLSNLKIIERHPHMMQVPYVPPGQDAAVFYGVQDFKIKNDTDSPVVIWADTEDNTLYMGFYGSVNPPNVTWHHEILNRQQAPTVYRTNSTLNKGEEKVLVPGLEGLSVKSWLTIEYSDSKKVTKDLGMDYYQPMPRVVERMS